MPDIQSVLLCGKESVFQDAECCVSPYLFLIGEKLKLRVVSQFVWGHTARKGQSLAWDEVSPTLLQVSTIHYLSEDVALSCLHSSHIVLTPCGPTSSGFTSQRPQIHLEAKSANGIFQGQLRHQSATQKARKFKVVPYYTVRLAFMKTKCYPVF